MRTIHRLLLPRMQEEGHQPLVDALLQGTTALAIGHAPDVCHTGLEPQTRRLQTGLLLTRLSLAFGRAQSSPSTSPASRSRRPVTLTLTRANPNPNPNPNPKANPNPNPNQGWPSTPWRMMVRPRPRSSMVKVSPWLCLFRARLAALGSSALPGRGRPTERPATASAARASRLQSR